MQNLSTYRALLSRSSFVRDTFRSCATHRSAMCLLIFVVSCGALSGQTAPSNRNDGGNSNSRVPASATQADPPPRSIRANDTYVIGADDVLSVIVWKEPDISKEIPVRSDGKISLPLVGEVTAAGRTPPQLEQDVTAKLKGYITDPEVTVIVQQMNSQKYNIFGQVGKPGTFPLLAETRIMDAIAAAGGLRDFAKKKDIYVLRQNPGGSDLRLPFNYDKFIKGRDSSQNIVIKPHDTIVVP
jgi:polysaccharide biosynthesis/export protein